MTIGTVAARTCARCLVTHLGAPCPATEENGPPPAMGIMDLILAGIPKPRFNPDAVGACRHVTAGADTHTGDPDEVHTLARVTVTQRYDGLPAQLVIHLADNERVEISPSEALHFVREATGLDVAGILDSLGHLDALAP